MHNPATARIICMLMITDFDLTHKFIINADGSVGDEVGKPLDG